MTPPISSFEVHDLGDLARARHLVRAIADRVGFEPRDQVAITSAVSGIVGSALDQSGGGKLEFRLEDDPERFLTIWMVAKASAAASAPSGTEPANPLVVRQPLPDPCQVVTASDAARIIEELLGLDMIATIEVWHEHDREVVQALGRLQAGELELQRLNAEREDLNQGILSLYVELDERAGALLRASQSKTRFLASLSHELRTPLSSILGLTRLLLDRSDGDLSTEQQRQLEFLLRSAEDLSGLVNNLLDLARIESGREVVHPSKVHLSELFAALRGATRPLLHPDSPVALVIEEPPELPVLFTDEAKLTQILRDFLSNALKFTTRGEIRLKAEANPAGDQVVFSVSDTGPGIAAEHLPRIFEEFVQLEGPRISPRNSKGLGLPLGSKLARLLGGHVDVESRPGLGSTFRVTIPVRIPSDEA